MFGEEPIKRTFAALGYDYMIIPNPNGKKVGDAKGRFQRIMADSISRGRLSPSA